MIIQRIEEIMNFSKTVIMGLTLALFFSVVSTDLAVAAGVGGVPARAALALEQVPRVAFPALDLGYVAEEDALREEDGLPFRFALPRDVHLNPDNSGTWETLPDGRLLWRLRISCPSVLSLNLGFTGYWLPWGASLKIYASDFTGPVFRFGADDNRSSGQMWTPVVLSTELVIELEIAPGQKDQVLLELGRVGCGYRYFGEDFSEKSGACNIDVVCSDGNNWREDIPSVGAYSFGGSIMCTGVLVNNTRQDKRPLFLTANHCDITSENAPTVVVYWNFESPVCGEQSGGTFEEFSHGSALLASSPTSDFALLELDESPDPVFGVSYAGWDRSASVPNSGVAIHHPSGDEKSISFEDDPLTITSNGSSISPGNGTHLRVEDWDLGTTEPGSSGSPLFNSSHRIVGQLHGGLAACGNNEPDWYGRLFTSWEGDGTSSTRLRDYLDPEGTGAVVLNRFGEVDPEPLPPGELSLQITLVAPNPFLHIAEVTFRLNQAAPVSGRVMNILGQQVRHLGTINGNEGDNVFPWDGMDDKGRPVAAGLYLIQLESNGKTARGQVIRLK
jgi:lysyl endopeptidase